MGGKITDFTLSGAERFSGVLAADMTRLEQALAGIPTDSAGVRLQTNDSLRKMLAAGGCIGAIPAQFLGPAAQPVRAVFFNKTAKTNWSLGWHQDRTICVKAKKEVAGFGPWTVKQGLIHVAPPVALLAKMLTVRVHLDDVTATNAPLLFSRGSHLEGMVPVEKVGETVERFGTELCLAHAGDLWLYSTLILHASAAAQDASSRRVLQVDYAAFDLPDGLEWQGV